MNAHVTPPLDLDAALLADGALWGAVNTAYQNSFSGPEAAMDVARAAVVEVRNRILATRARTNAGAAVKLAIFSYSAPNDYAAEDTTYRADHLAELIAQGLYEDAAAFSLAIDLADMMPGPAAMPQPIVPFTPKRCGGPTLSLAA